MNDTQPSAAIQTSTIPVILALSVEEMYRPGGVVHIHTANDQESQHLADRLRDALVAIENDDGSVRFIQNFGSFTITELASALIPGRIVLSDASAELISAPSPFTRRFVTPDAQRLEWRRANESPRVSVNSATRNLDISSEPEPAPKKASTAPAPVSDQKAQAEIDGKPARDVLLRRVADLEKQVSMLGRVCKMADEEVANKVGAFLEAHEDWHRSLMEAEKKIEMLESKLESQHEVRGIVSRTHVKELEKKQKATAERLEAAISDMHKYLSIATQVSKRVDVLEQGPGTISKEEGEKLRIQVANIASSQRAALGDTTSLGMKVEDLLSRMQQTNHHLAFHRDAILLLDSEMQKLSRRYVKQRAQRGDIMPASRLPEPEQPVKERRGTRTR